MSDRRHLLVLGCGFGGYSLLNDLDRRRFAVTLISPRNYFLFTPLLPSAITGTVEFRSILEPARRRLRGVEVIEAWADSVDLQAREVRCRGAIDEEPFKIGFDILVISVGAAIADYGVPGVAEVAHKLSSVEEARGVRRGILEQFAKAEVPGLTGTQRRERLRFVICGGGPTGVEVAAEIHDLIHGEIWKDYPEFAPLCSVVLVEAQDRLLSSYDLALAQYAKQHFTRGGIEVRTSQLVEGIEPGLVRLRGGEVIHCGLIMWAGGNAPASLVSSLGGGRLVEGRLPVDGFLRVPEHAEIYALGDCAARGEPPLPATAQVAEQEGRYLARALVRREAGKPLKEFKFHQRGMLAYIGQDQALADLPQFKWSGRAAWLFWRSVYITKQVSLSNKVKVLFDWVKARVFGRDLSRF